MNFWAFQAPLGYGKTLGASIFALHYKQQSGCALYTNYGLKGSKPFTDIQDFKLIAMESSSILVLDESHMDLDARSFSTNHVKFFTQLSYYLRKLRCTLIMTTPSFSDIDSRVRGITNILMNVKKDSKYFYYETWDVQSVKYLKTTRIKKEFAFQIAEHYFDTNNFVTPIEIIGDRNDWKEYLNELKLIAESYHIKRRAEALLAPEVLEVI